jgi:hypothetical protein
MSVYCNKRKVMAYGVSYLNKQYLECFTALR